MRSEIPRVLACATALHRFLSPNGETNVVQHLSTNGNILNCQAGEEKDLFVSKEADVRERDGVYVSNETDVRERDCFCVSIENNVREMDCFWLSIETNVREQVCFYLSIEAYVRERDGCDVSK